MAASNSSAQEAALTLIESHRYCVPITFKSFLIGLHLVLKSNHIYNVLLARLPPAIPAELVIIIHDSIMALEAQDAERAWKENPFAHRRLFNVEGRVEAAGGLQKVLGVDAPVGFSLTTDWTGDMEVFLSCGTAPAKGPSNRLGLLDDWPPVAEHITDYRAGDIFAAEANPRLESVMHGWDTAAAQEVAKLLGLRLAMPKPSGTADRFVVERVALRSFIGVPAQDWRGCSLRLGASLKQF
ncbi:MAG: hypothetical protein M1832_001657 [Thelocarpon impressellum]|nr:MAG: hypothetical protein M1832_001657 [Thelocarpon impressellum]